MSNVLAIDPGTTESAFALVDADTKRPVEIGKIRNDHLFHAIHEGEYDHLAIEMVASYGMAVGAEVFHTCVWVGRYFQYALEWGPPDINPQLVYRLRVKLHHCGSAKAKDSNITQSLIDRFAAGQPNRGKGTKAAPGWFYGFKADVWQAYALAVYVADTIIVPF